MIATQDWQSLQDKADRARQGAAPEQAIELYNQALALTGLTWEQRYASTLGRAESRRMLGLQEALETELLALAEQAREQLGQRTAELTIINRVQEGLVRQLEFQAIIDLVGSEVMRIFPPPKEKAHLYSVFIALYDPETDLVQYPYWADPLGNRFHQPPVKLGLGLTSTVIRSRQALTLKNWGELQDGGAIIFDDGNPDEFSQSWLGVPILIGEQVTGVICVQDPREALYTEADVRLLSTLAAGLGVALENARLFTETQRLLEESQRRMAELVMLS
jgi:transcriptional regulator with GAF, ATPase, and Fis domain